MKFKSLFFLLLIIPGIIYAWPYNLPRGNYQDTCNACTFVDGQLSCYCVKRNGRSHFTSMYVEPRCKFIQNQNGHLRCTKWRHHRRYNPWYPPQPQQPRVRNFDAGPIWSQADASQKCPRVCGVRNWRWTGGWKTTVPGQASVCTCKRY